MSGVYGMVTGSGRSSIEIVDRRDVYLPHRSIDQGKDSMVAYGNACYIEY